MTNIETEKMDWREMQFNGFIEHIMDLPLTALEADVIQDCILDLHKSYHKKWEEFDKKVRELQEVVNVRKRNPPKHDYADVDAPADRPSMGCEVKYHEPYCPVCRKEQDDITKFVP